VLHPKAEYICADSLSSRTFPCSRTADHTFSDKVAWRNSTSSKPPITEREPNGKLLPRMVRFSQISVLLRSSKIHLDAIPKRGKSLSRRRREFLRVTAFEEGYC
jgi:hypothetical protein